MFLDCLVIRLFYDNNNLNYSIDNIAHTHIPTLTRKRYELNAQARIDQHLTFEEY